MKKFLMVLMILALFAMPILADSGELKSDLKEAFEYAVYTLLIAIVGIITAHVRKALNSFVEKHKDESYYRAIKQVEEIIQPLIAEAEAKLVAEIKKKFDKDDPQRHVELGKVANDVLEETEKNIPDKVRHDLEKHGESVRGILPKLLEPQVKKHRWLGLIDFREVRDKLNIPKI